MKDFWEENNAEIKYSSGQWARAYGSIYHGSFVMRTKAIGDSMSIQFQGNAIQFMGAQGWDHGSFVVNLDGEESVVDGYCCGPNGGAPQVIQFEATGLNNTQHVLNVTNLAAGPNGTVLEVDGLIIGHPDDKYAAHLSLAMSLVILANLILLFVLAAIRRRLIKLGLINKTSCQILPLSSPDLSSPERIPSAAVPPPPQKAVLPETGAAQPPYATGEGSDELVERIAQRVAMLVQESPPPTYNTAIPPTG
ncbi:hypothetical protein C8R44DRAFT_885072 [Mycena epipterygia]|nr:hypothetical protein C8R44DRAFT_885072 [Mycena epipterygia]